MAARADRYPVELVDLRSVAAKRLEGLLADETKHWREELHWDFAPAAELVRQYVGTSSLNGFALVERTFSVSVVGYGYYVCEGNKALIGDLYVARHSASRENEYLLLNALLDELRRTPSVVRVECQLMMLQNGTERTPVPEGFPGAETLRSFGRHFMAASISDWHAPPALPAGFDVVPWNDVWQDETARLIAASYHQHIDSEINDQYRTSSGARRFVTNIVQYPGCGRFFAPGSLAVVDRASRSLAGLCLASIVSRGVGHITQICVAPQAQGKGLGRELLRRSIEALALGGCGEVGLTVTASNAPAVKLYESMGFRKVRSFSANVWDWS